VITLSNGHTFEHMVASGALAFDGKGWLWERPLVWVGLIRPELFTVVIKTLTLNPRLGNQQWWKPWTCIRLIPGGSVNKIGLTNPGIEWWCKKIAPHIDFHRFPIVGSIYGEAHELVPMANMFNQFDVVGLEINPSCPNTGHALQNTETVVRSVGIVKQVSRHPIIVKVSVNQSYLQIADALKGIAEAISLNSVPWEVAYSNGKVSPLWRLEKKVGGGGGGVSGRPAQKYNWAAVEALAKQGALHVIAPSVMEFEDIAKVRGLGASAVSFGAIHLRTPWKPTSIVRKEHLQ
jgi:dihydroorotate dehydrogenase